MPVSALRRFHAYHDDVFIVRYAPFADRPLLGQSQTYGDLESELAPSTALETCFGWDASQAVTIECRRSLR